MTTILSSSVDHFQWGPVFVGTVVALAIAVVLMQFGAVIGLSASASLRGEGHIASWGVIATGVWILWVQLLASFAGGYSAGYLHTPTPNLKSHQNEITDGFYGLSVWATSAVLVFIGTALAGVFATYVALASGTYEDPVVLSNNEKNAAIIFAFTLGAVSLLSAAASWWAATMAGEHRLQETDFSQYLSFKK
ncbi:MAG: hypothetical protein CO093_04945 [Alphaproteobacteria bacterium CG_4_9_14_3_um_filter_47_13]|nr:MAG: hypothetical protein CO093_04945 [Alphaproteobacteria bacterium CG_4_9_14_3_um_filter_47_13]